MDHAPPPPADAGLASDRAALRAVVTELAETPPEAIERIALEPMPPIDLAALSPRDVVVQVKSASVGWVDLIMTSGQYQHLPKPPYTPGLEYAGVIAWLGPEANAPGQPELAVGQEVLVDPFLAGPRTAGDYQRWGGWATYAVAPREAILRVPGALSLDAACNLLGNYETAYHCLVTRGRLQPGETVLDVVELLEATVNSPSCGELGASTQGFTVYDVVVGPSGGGGGEA